LYGRGMEEELPAHEWQRATVNSTHALLMPPYNQRTVLQREPLA